MSETNDIGKAAPAIGWRLIAFRDDEDWEVERYVTADDEIIAVVEGLLYDGAPKYPHAFDPAGRVWRRGGAFADTPSAKGWAERIAGLAPRRPEDGNEQPHHPLSGVHPSVRMIAR